MVGGLRGVQVPHISGSPDGGLVWEVLEIRHWGRAARNEPQSEGHPRGPGVTPSRGGGGGGGGPGGGGGGGGRGLGGGGGGALGVKV